MARRPFDPRLVRSSEPSSSSALSGGTLTVSQLTSLVKTAVETVLPPTVHVVGQVSNHKRHSSGHHYFTLKDAQSELACVMWRSSTAAMKFELRDGLEVIATGAVTVFERAGRYQLVVRRVEPRGVGALELAFRQLCEKLAGDGLFDAARKRSLPAFPERIAIVTSPTGAAIGDILRTIHRRYPCVQVFLYPVRVQGDGAAAEIARAIRRINEENERLGGVDVMIVGRGGGSIEELWAFNEEVVARAIAASRIPIISAVGHESDVTIADFVADVRAATPTAAAELAVPVLADIVNQIDERRERMRRALLGRVAVGRAKIDGLMRRPAVADPVAIVRRREQWLDEWTNVVHRTLVTRTHRFRVILERAEPKVRRIAPHLVLMQRALRLAEAVHRLDRAGRASTSGGEVRLGRLIARLERLHPEPLAATARERVERLADRLSADIRRERDQLAESLKRESARLAALSYRSVLERGFSITRRRKDGAIVRSIQDIRDRARIMTQTANGEFESEVINLSQLELFDDPQQ